MIEKCSSCLKIQDLCICQSLQPLNTQVHVLILQHPQEPDQDLGSARLAHLSLPNSTLKIGLSWPNLRAALGKQNPVAEVANVSHWAVLYLGSGLKRQQETTLRQHTGATSRKKTSPQKREKLQFVSRQGTPVLSPAQVEGIVILDGTWSQAKALWWRNAWLLKLKRAILQPARPSLYEELRKEPKKECLSTIESIAEALDALGEPAPTANELRAVFSRLLDKQRERVSRSSRQGKPRP